MVDPFMATILICESAHKNS